MTREEIGRVWAAVCEGDAARTAVGVQAVCDWHPSFGTVTLYAAFASTLAGWWREVVARGITEEEALAALWELVCLHARMRVDDIETAYRRAA